MGDTAWHWAKCISEIESGITMDFGRQLPKQVQYNVVKW